MISTDRVRRAAHEAEQEAVQHRSRWILAATIIVFVAACSVAAIAFFSVYSNLGAVRGQVAAISQQSNENAEAAQTLAQQVRELGQVPRVEPPVTMPPSTEVVTLAPSRADIAAAVATYLSQNPPPEGKAPTLDQITAAVAGYLTANPPQPGRPPTVDEIRSAVAGYLTDNPPAAGKDGADGDPGRPPTDAEIDAAVARYFAANPPPAGEKGEKGDQGEKGEQGEPGPSCPAGYSLQEVHYVTANGKVGAAGLGCVAD